MTSEELIALLDPDRDYGKPGYKGTIENIRAGKALITEGTELPILKHALTGEALKGSGRPAQNQIAREQSRRDTIVWGKREFAQRAAKDFDVAYDALFVAVKKADMKAHAIFWDHFLGRAKEAEGGDVPEVARLFLEHMERQGEQKPTTIIDV